MGQSSTGSCRHCCVDRVPRLLTDEEVVEVRLKKKSPPLFHLSFASKASILVYSLRPPTPPHPSVFCRARHGHDEEVIDRVGRLLGIHEVVELRLVLLKRLLDTAYHCQSLPSFRLGRVHGLYRPCFFLALSISKRLQSRESGHACRCSLPLEVGFQF